MRRFIATIFLLLCGIAHAEGWGPSSAEKAAVEKLIASYFEAINSSHYEQAYALLSPGMKELVPFERWKELDTHFQKVANGNPKYWNVKSTWYKDPPNASLPGVYAAFDLDCSYTNINICHEVVILHQQSDGSFLVMRHERNFIDKSTEEKLKSRKQVPEKA